jgi:hypothetical protein
MTGYKLTALQGAFGACMACSASTAYRMTGHPIMLLGAFGAWHVQGDYIGLRSPWAGNRFLQARRKMPHMALYSTLFGVWEQWQVGSLSCRFYAS